MAVEVRVLGVTRALRDGEPVDLGGRKPREVLAVLAASAGRPVSAAVLADRVWRGSPPPTANTTLQGYVSRLRRLLEDDRARPRVLLTVNDSYALGEAVVDAAQLQGLIEQARQSSRNGRVQAAVDFLTAALGLWDGEALADIRDVPDLLPEAGRLDELRLSVLEERAAALLGTGQGPELVADLRLHADHHPLRERAQSLLARALYRSGRQAEALEVLQRLRQRLDDELGVDLSTEVRHLQQAVLRQDPALDAPAPPAPSTPTPPAPPAPLSEADFVGRQSELSTLLQAWSAARADRTTAVAITGEPGIGKSRLVEELVRRSAATVRWGRCPEIAGAPPYWPWQQVLGSLPPVAGDDPGGRWALGYDVAVRLRALAEQGPWLLVLDDLQWADGDSLQLLEVVLTELRDAPLLLVVTCRESPPAAVEAVLAHLARLPSARRLVLAGLPATDVAELVAVVGDGPLTAEQASALTARTGGNPYFVRELAALGGDALGAVPATVRDVVRLRLGGLGEEAYELVALLAVAARDLALGLVAAALGRSLAELQGPLVAALGSGLLVEPAPGRVRLAHDLVRDCLRHDLGPGRRAALHGALAEALAAGPGAAADATAIAVHRSEAALGGVDEAAAAACLVAAEVCLERAADAEALELARRGSQHASPAATALTGDLQHALGVAARRLGLLEESRTALLAEAALARGTGDLPRLARAAVDAAGGGVGGYWTFAAPLTTDVELLQEAADTVDGLDPELASTVLAALAVQLSARGEAGGAELAGRALAMAQTPGARRQALVASYVAGWTPASAADRVRLAEELLRLSVGHPGVEGTALHLLRAALLESGRFAESAAVSRRFGRLAEHRGDADLRLLDTWWRVGQHLVRGEHEAARELGDTASGDTPAVSPVAAGLARSSRATAEGIIAWHEGRLIDLVPEAVDLAASVEPEWLVIQALGHAEAGHTDAAAAAVGRLREVPSAGAREPVRVILLAEVFVALGDAQGCAELLAVLERYGDTVVLLWPGLVTLGPTALYRGSLLAVLGETERARAELEAACALAEEMGAAPYLARARRRLATLKGGRHF